MGGLGAGAPMAEGPTPPMPPTLPMGGASLEGGAPNLEGIEI
jgi:hypothetical protein